MSRGFARGVAWCLLLVCFAGSATTIVHAEVLRSESYQLEESSIGSGGMLRSSSENFKARSALGDLSVGRTASEGGTQTETGSVTTNDPALSFTINTASPTLGNFTASGATMATASFSVSNYTSYGYVVTIAGDPPSNGDQTIDAMAETGPSQPGTKQFGVNLVANTLPENIGANPDQGDFGEGEAAPNYGTPNEYRYVSGETIALAPKSSGITTYTISYLVNVEPLTPGGRYTTHQTLIVTGTF